MDKRVSYNNKIEIGFIGRSYRCGEFEIISTDGRYITVKFLNTNNIDSFRKDHVKEGRIKDQKAPLTFGVGYTDGEVTKNEAEDHLPYYRHWKQILERSYCPKLKKKYPSYDNVTVCEDWHSLKNFKIWFDNNYQQGWDQYCLDKDLLCDQLNFKIYSPETCVFLPHRLNTLIIKRYKNRKNKELPIGITKKSKNSKYCARCQIGESQPHVIGYYKDLNEAWEVYRNFKQNYIKELSEDYFNKGLIDERAYKALMNYKVIKEYQ